MRFSISGFLFEDNYTSQSLDLEEFCAVAARLGYDGVELRRTQIAPTATHERRAEVLGAVKASGLSVTCLTARGIPSAGPARERALESYLRLCTDLDCPLLKVSGEPEWMRSAAERAACCGVHLAVNNHAGTPLETLVGTVRYFREIDHPNVGLLYDSYHLFAMGEDYVGAVEVLVERIRNVLVHSVRPARSEAEGAASLRVGEHRFVRCMPYDDGAQNWPAVFRALRRVGYDGLVTVIESGWPAGRREEVARGNLQYLWELSGQGLEEPP